MICGLADMLTVTGNQTAKNTIRYLAEFGHDVSVFGLSAKGYPNLLDKGKVFGDKVQFYHLPDNFVPVLKAARKFKDTVGKAFKKGEPTELQEKHTDYADYNLLGRALYIFLSFVIYPLFEIPRVSWLCLRHGVPDLYYGVNRQGAIVAVLMARLTGRPVVTRFHGTQMRESHFRRLRDRLYVLDEYVAMKMTADAVIVGQDGSRGDRILQLMGVPADRIYSWTNGLDTEDLLLSGEWDRDSMRQSLGVGDRKVVLMVSELRRWKRVERGIHCIQSLKHSGADDVVLVICGRGPEELRLRSIAEKSGVGDLVVFAGGVAHSKVGEYFAMADIFLSTFDHANRGNPLLEAMYFGLPIVTINDGTTDGLLENGTSVLLADPLKLQEELPAKVQELIANPNLRARIGENAKKACDRHVLSWRDRMRKEDELIRHLVATPKMA